MKNKKHGAITDYIKASRKGSREAEMEDESGFLSKHKVFKSVKTYSRKSKHRQQY